MAVCAIPRSGSRHTALQSREQLRHRWSFREVEHVAIVLKPHVFRVAMAGKELQDPLLLLRREQPLAPVIAVVRTVSAQVFLHLRAQHREVLLLHFAKEGAEAVGGVDDPDLLEVPAAAVSES